MIAGAMGNWLNQLQPGGSVYQSWSMTASASGYGLNEAPRGAVGYWLQIQNGAIGNYQLVVPFTWNFGPRCSADKPGPVESALVGSPVVDPKRPVEILRTIHSFDPCIACAVHVIDPQEDLHLYNQGCVDPAGLSCITRACRNNHRQALVFEIPATLFGRLCPTILFAATMKGCQDEKGKSEKKSS